MHQIVLVVGKSKFLIIFRKEQLMQRTETLVTGVEEPFDSQQRTKSLSDIQFSKGFDFKQICFILRFLFFNVFPIEGSYFK